MEMNLHSEVTGNIASQAEISDARHLVHDMFTAWHLQAAIDDAELVISELAQNAFRYGQQPVVARLEYDGEHATCTIHDSGYWEAPDIENADADAEHGRGMFIAQAVS